MKTIAIDFDGVIHDYTLGYHDGTIYGQPIVGALKAVDRLIRRGYTVVVLTARPNHEEIRTWIWKNGQEEGLDLKLAVTSTKPKAIAYVDDRAVRFTSWKDVLNYF